MIQSSDNSIEPTAVQKRGMRSAVIHQCFGALGMLAFTNGMILLYLTALKVPPAMILVFLALVDLLPGLLSMSGAWFSRRYRKKTFGAAGLWCQAAGFVILTAVGCFAGHVLYAVLAAAIGVYAFGSMLSTATWFSLMQPVVPVSMRGRFWGNLRFTWQMIGAGFGLAVAAFLGKDSPVWMFQVLMGVIAAGLVVRVAFFLQIPELEPIDVEHPDDQGLTFIGTLKHIIQAEGFMSFTAYVFLLGLFTAGCPALFALVEKDVLGLGDSQIMILTFLAMVGAMFGFFLGGRLVDRTGTRVVFLACHGGYALVLALFLLRGMFGEGLAMMIVLGAANLAFGLIAATASVAITSEMYSLIPADNKSMSTSLFVSMGRLSRAMAPMLSAWVLRQGILKGSWQWFGRNLSDYDALLLGCMGMVGILVVTLGLVPSVLGRSDMTGQTLH